MLAQFGMQLRNCKNAKNWLGRVGFLAIYVLTVGSSTTDDSILFLLRKRKQQDYMFQKTFQVSTLSTS